MRKCLTCILCPSGCEIETEQEGKQVISIVGNLCPKGKEYAEQELMAPMRSIASLVKLNGGELPLVSVRLSKPIPKERLMDVMAEIKKQTLSAPTHIGQVVIVNVLGLNSNVIVTKNIKAE
ncbi:MAG TPA: DUF1667 domain-containing protein [Bacillota bacterium]|nr:DUF1667 domain-containing protein [Bacillota bacterium]